jgi:hypothetical protein
MPIYLDTYRLERVVMIVARGKISDGDLAKATQDLLPADVVAYAKIIDTSASTAHETIEQVAAICRTLREGPGSEARGPVACVVDAQRPGFAEQFAAQSGAERPIKLFTSLREARRWAAETMAGEG